MGKAKEKLSGLKLASGNLSKPIKLPALYYIFASEPDNNYINSYLEHAAEPYRVEKLELLADELGIKRDDPERWLKIALLLATEYLPGFKVLRPDQRPGRPKDWTREKHECFFKMYLELKDYGKSDREICNDISEIGLLKNRHGQVFSSQSLRNHLNKYKKLPHYMEIFRKLILNES